MLTRKYASLMYTVFTVCKVNRTMKRNKYVLLFDDDDDGLMKYMNNEVM